MIEEYSHFYSGLGYPANKKSLELRERIDDIIRSALQCAEMRQGCTDYTPYVEVLRNEIITLLKEALPD